MDDAEEEAAAARRASEQLFEEGTQSALDEGMETAGTEEGAAAAG